MVVIALEFRKENMVVYFQNRVHESYRPIVVWVISAAFVLKDRRDHALLGFHRDFFLPSSVIENSGYVASSLLSRENEGLVGNFVRSWGFSGL